MSRKLEFKSVPHSFNGETLAAQLVNVCQPFTISVQTSADGSEVFVDVPDDCLADGEIGDIVALHAHNSLAVYRQEQFEATRAKARKHELLTTLKHQHAIWKRSKLYTGDSRDRIIDLIVEVLRDKGV